MKKDESTINERLIHVLEWLYTMDGAYVDKNEWRHDLVAHLYWLTGVKPVRCEGDEDECDCDKT
jgi:hypothetical protein